MSSLAPPACQPDQPEAGHDQTGKARADDGAGDRAVARRVGAELDGGWTRNADTARFATYALKHDALIPCEEVIQGDGGQIILVNEVQPERAGRGEGVEQTATATGATAGVGAEVHYADARRSAGDIRAKLDSVEDRAGDPREVRVSGFG